MHTSSGKKKDITDTSNIIIVEKMRDYSNDPFVKKKAEDARELLKKYPLPEWFTKKSK